MTGRIFVPNAASVFQRIVRTKAAQKFGFVKLYNQSHDVRPFVDTTFIIVTDTMIDEIYSVCDAQPVEKGFPIERHLLITSRDTAAVTSRDTAAVEAGPLYHNPC